MTAILSRGRWINRANTQCGLVTLMNASELGETPGSVPSHYLDQCWMRRTIVEMIIIVSLYSSVELLSVTGAKEQFSVKFQFEIRTFSVKKINLLSAKCWPFCFDFNGLNQVFKGIYVAEIDSTALNAIPSSKRHRVPKHIPLDFETIREPGSDAHGDGTAFH